MPQTSQSWPAERGGGSADVADEEADADVDAVDEAAPSTTPTIPREDAVAEGEGGEGWGDNDGDVEVDGSVAALGGFPPFFFVMGWCVGVLEA